jgi:hypothetical protein
MSSSLSRSQDSPVYVAFGWAARINDRTVTSRPCASFPQLYSQWTTNGRCCSRASLKCANDTAAAPRRASERWIIERDLWLPQYIHCRWRLACYCCILARVRRADRRLFPAATRSSADPASLHPCTKASGWEGSSAHAEETIDANAIAVLQRGWRNKRTDGGITGGKCFSIIFPSNAVWVEINSASRASKGPTGYCDDGRRETCR